MFARVCVCECVRACVRHTRWRVNLSPNLSPNLTPVVQVQQLEAAARAAGDVIDAVKDPNVGVAGGGGGPHGDAAGSPGSDGRRVMQLMAHLSTLDAKAALLRGELARKRVGAVEHTLAAVVPTPPRDSPDLTVAGAADVWPAGAGGSLPRTPSPEPLYPQLM
jgi:hypothetical protein